MNKKNIPSLTGFRAIAAYLVFISHFVFFYPNIFSKSWNFFFCEMYIGVAMFFVLSGFLITYQYYNSEKFTFKNYMIKRFARIYPLYFILTSLIFIFNSNSVTHFKLYILNITFLRSFFVDFLKTGIASGWSLTVEEMFYILAPLLFLLIKKSYKYFIFIPLFFWLLGLLIVIICKNFNFYGFMDDYSFMFNYTIFGRISEFLIGIALALFYEKYKESFKTKYATIFGLTIIFIGVYLMSIIKPDVINDGFDLFFGKILNTFFIPLFGIVPLFYGLMTEKTFFSKLLSSKIFQLLGKSSYAFYLIHVDLLNYFSNNNLVNNYFIEFLLLNIIAIGLYLFIESPINNLIRKRFIG